MENVKQYENEAKIWNTKFSPRKRQILWLVVKNHRWTRKHVAEKLGIALSTVGTYMTSILEITGCDDKFHLYVEWSEFLKDIPFPPANERSKKKKQ